MTVTVEVLRERVEALEREVADLRQVLRRPKADETPAERGARLLREAKANQPAISAAIAKAFAEMGLTGEPVSHEELRKLFAESGIDSEENWFSREIKAMREE